MFTRDGSPARGSSAHPLMRLLGTLARLALFQAQSPVTPTFIAVEPDAPALSWIRCRLLATHDYGVRCEPGRVFLACRRCGTRSRGWTFEETPYEARARVVPAPAVRALPRETVPASVRTAQEPAVPSPAVAPVALGAPRAWRTVRPWGRAFMDSHRPRGALVVGGPAVDLAARALGPPTRLRVHAARDPPAAWRLAPGERPPRLHSLPAQTVCPAAVSATYRLEAKVCHSVSYCSSE